MAVARPERKDHLQRSYFERPLRSADDQNLYINYDIKGEGVGRGAESGLEEAIEAGLVAISIEQGTHINDITLDNSQRRRGRRKNHDCLGSVWYSAECDAKAWMTGEKYGNWVILTDGVVQTW